MKVPQLLAPNGHPSNLTPEQYRLNYAKLEGQEFHIGQDVYYFAGALKGFDYSENLKSIYDDNKLYDNKLYPNIELAKVEEYDANERDGNIYGIVFENGSRTFEHSSQYLRIRKFYHAIGNIGIYHGLCFG
jgi:hypothetical protein